MTGYGDFAEREVDMCCWGMHRGVFRALGREVLLPVAAKVSCCGAQNFHAALRRTLEILTAATRSPRFIRHWRRSDRSPKGQPETQVSGLPARCFCVRICGLLPRGRGNDLISQRMTHRLSFLGRCRSCGGTVGDGSLYGGAMWASPPTNGYGRFS